MELTSTALVCPRGDGKGEPITLNLAKILETEARLAELAFITLDKAPELMSAFNKSWLELQRTATVLRYELVKAEDSTRKRRALILLDYAEDLLKARGLKSSADLREAIVESDDVYSETKDRAAFLKAVVALLEGKMAAFENGFTAIKKLMSTIQLPSQPIRDRGFEKEESPLHPGFGVPSY
jgi:hypothetical protein